MCKLDVATRRQTNKKYSLNDLLFRLLKNMIRLKRDTLYAEKMSRKK